MASFCAFGLKEELVQAVQEVVPKVQSSNKIDYVKIAKEAQRWVFAFVGITTMVCLIIIGAKMFHADGNSEELKSSMMGIFYIIIGLALIPFAYFIIRLISQIRIWWN